MIDSTFDTLKALLKRHAKGPLTLEHGVIGSTAKVLKPQAHLYGKKEVAIEGRPQRRTYVAGVIEQKNFTGFYLMPMYSHPQILKTLSPELKKVLKGKSCLNIVSLTPATLKEIEKLLKEGIKRYQQGGWI